MKRDYGSDDRRLTGSVDRIGLQKAIADLPPGYRTVFVLHDVEGYEHNEIAEIMKCSVGNSKSQLHKARMKLRERLRQDRDIKAPGNIPRLEHSGRSVRGLIEESRYHALAACSRFEAELEAYLEGEARPFVTSHAHDCVSCGALMADLQSIRVAARANCPRKTPRTWFGQRSAPPSKPREP